jgi:AraC-like DNA-binding protein
MTRRPRKPAVVVAPLMNLNLGCGRTVSRRLRMPHFVRRPAVAMHLLVEGGIQVLMATGRRWEYEIGRLTLTWGAMPHLADYTAKRNVTWTAAFPVGLFLRWGLPAEFVATVLRGEPVVEPDASRGAFDTAMMERWSDDLRRHRDNPAESRRIMLMELEARTRRLARDAIIANSRRGAARAKRNAARTKNVVSPTNQPDVSGAANSRTAPADQRVERMLQLIAQSGVQEDARFPTMRSILHVSDLAAAVGIHPDTASRLFERSVGMGLQAFLTQHRIAVAQGLLASTDAKVPAVAAAAGFGSTSQFHAIFHRETGITPRRYREAVYRA